MCNLKEIWPKLPILLKSVAIITPVSFVSLILGFAVPLWFRLAGKIPTTVTNIDGDITGIYVFDHFGLWQICGSDFGCITLNDVPAYVIATRFFVTVGFIGSFVHMVAVVMFIFIPNWSGNGRLSVFIFILSIVVAACLSLGVIIFGAEVKYYLNFGFACTCISAILYTVVAAVMGLFFCMK